MGLESPLLLLGLALAALPFFLHRAKLRELSLVSLPTVELLRRAKAAKRSVLRVSDPFLLLLRMLLIACLVLGIAGPYRTGASLLGDLDGLGLSDLGAGQSLSLVIVIDDSMSMGQTSEGGVSLFSRALDQAQDAIGALAAGSSVALVAASEPARMLCPRTADLVAAQQCLLTAGRKLPSMRGNDWAGAIRVAKAAVDRTKKEWRIAVLTDGAGEAGEQLRQLADAEAERVRVLRIRDDARALQTPANVALIEASVALDGSSADLVASARLQGALGDGSNRTVRVSADGREVGRKSVTLVDGKGTVEILIASARDVSVFEFELVEQDALAMDNRRYATLASSEPRVLVLLDDGGSPLDQKLFAAGFRSLATTGLSVRVDFRSTQGIESLDLRSEALVVVDGSQSLSSTAVERLLRYAENGGGLVLLPSYLEATPTAEQLLGPSGLASAAHERGDFRFLTDSSPVVAKERLSLEPRDATQVLARFSDGQAAVTQASLKAGRVVAVAIPLSGASSDFGFSPQFVAMLDLWVRQAGDARLLGEVAGLRVPDGVTDARLIDLAGTETRLAVRNGSLVAPPGSVYYTPGVYRVGHGHADGSVTEPLDAVRIVQWPASESELSVRAELVRATARQGRDVRRGVLAEPVHRPIASSVWLFAAFVACIEGIVRAIKKRKLS